MCFSVAASPHFVGKLRLERKQAMAKNTRCRSAVTGKFVKQSYADKHPKTTVKETVKKKTK